MDLPAVIVLVAYAALFFGVVALAVIKVEKEQKQRDR